MIFGSPVPRARFIDLLCEAGRSTPMMFANRSALSCRAIFFLSILIGIPGAARSGTLEDSATQLARKISAALPAGESISCEVKNISSLQAGEVSRIDQALRAELQVRGARVVEKGGAETRVLVTLSENWRDFVWTGEIRHAEDSRAVLVSFPRASEAHTASNAMHVTVRSEKFWEGPDRILDAAESFNGTGRSWLVLLLPSKLWIQDMQTGTASTVDIPLGQAASREPSGKLGEAKAGGTLWFGAASRICKLDLEARTPPECLLKDGADAPPGGRDPFPMILDLSPAGPPPSGKGMELVITPVCGGASQFLATSARDYTQTDSVQVFQTEPNGPTAMSAELDFPGPILALHSTADAPRAIARNLSTGNYEAYRLAISCGQ